MGSSHLDKLFLNMFKKLIDSFVFNFGFNDVNELMGSMIHSKLLVFTFSIGAFGAVVEKYFGLMPVTLFAFGLLLFLELISGLWASRVKGLKIESRKFSRFGLKFFIWTLVFLVVNILKLQFASNNVVAFHFWDWLHTFIISYVSLEYLISVIENVGVISGKDNTKLIKLITGKFKVIENTDKKD